MYDGTWCSGNDTDVQPCDMDPCPGKDCLLYTRCLETYMKAYNNKVMKQHFYKVQ